MATYERTKAGYQNLWNQAQLDAPRVDEITSAATKILANMERYWAIEMSTGVPWFWIACVHYRESALNFVGVLHNGEAIIGTGKKTSLVPAGRGPFATWEEAAIDAVKLKQLDKIDDWPVSRLLFEFERYNGWGYMGRINSPYVWAGTSLSNEVGKYIKDGVYDPKAVEKQLGCAAILKQLASVDNAIAERLDMTLPPAPPPVSVPAPPEPPRYTIPQLTKMLADAMGCDEITVAATTRIKK